jgi:Hint domain-containing protein
MNKLIAFALAVFLTACSIIPAAGSVPTPVVITAQVSTVMAETLGPLPTEGPAPTSVPPTPIPTLTSGTSPTELKYQVLAKYPDFFFCDPDFYPVARADEPELALQIFAELQSNQEEFQAILAHIGLAGSTTFTDDQKLLIYQEHKKLNAITFELTGDKYEFQIQTGAEGQQGAVITGTIDSTGSIQVLDQQPSIPTCPICLAVGTLIDTPRGPVRVEDLHVGDLVWTMDESGARVSGTILRVGSVRVPSTHKMIHVTLDDGRELWASPGHPTAAGRALGDLHVGDILDGAKIIHLERVPYRGVYTYDILPLGETGFYWANGVLLGSTLAK